MEKMEIKLDIIYEDKDIIAVNKAAGIPVIPGRNLDITPLSTILSEHVGVSVFIVHRIDKETSGLVLFAKNAEAHRELCLQFEKHTIEKHYMAIVSGQIANNFIINEPIREFGSGRMGVSTNGKPSRTQISIVKKTDMYTLIDAQPVTGRRHQIRVHLYHIGHPIIGDPLYGLERPVGGFSRLMLHNREIKFTHPKTKISCTLQAAVGEDWIKIADKIGLKS